MKATVIKTTGEFVHLEFDRSEVVNQIHEQVGGIFTVVDGTDWEFPFVAYVHDEGLLIDLPTNYIACALLGRIIAGDVFLLGDCDENGDSQDVPEVFRNPNVEQYLQKFMHPSYAGFMDVTRSKMNFTPAIYSFDEYMEMLVK
jgi:hypothetical protein